jgi:hypothetical protein
VAGCLLLLLQVPVLQHLGIFAVEAKVALLQVLCKE